MLSVSSAVGVRLHGAERAHRLWGLKMPRRLAAENADATTRDQRIDRALTLLRESLSIIDNEEVTPAIGARLQEVICGLEEDVRPPNRRKES